ncbi:MAG TPA: apolipoprotein N-acyltransferase [Pyrinomonadaceae bacterium]|nr:apolipoprotein N-acyltransferase [Pyrinomonadaceae bacterium]
MPDVAVNRSPLQARLFTSSLLGYHQRFSALIDYGGALLSSLLLILAFPSFELWSLAWFALSPLLIVCIANRRRWRPFFLGWLFGTVFFYGSCYWLTYSMIHTAGLPRWIAYLLLVPGAVLLGLFPALFGLFISRLAGKFGSRMLMLAPFAWIGLEWLRLEITGQLWNAIGYSQAFHPAWISAANWGGVYAVGFFIVLVNAALAFALIEHNARALIVLIASVVVSAFGLAYAPPGPLDSIANSGETVEVVAIQPNVPMDLSKSNEELKNLMTRHLEMSEGALSQLTDGLHPVLLVWPESPMNFAYGSDAQLRATLAEFAQKHRVSILLNSQEAAPNDGIYNSAVLVNEEGKLVVQYDKIRLLPFGEYVPLPDWVPGSGLIRAIVGDFTAGTNYQLMPVGNLRAGVFICIESAYPSIARRFSQAGANVLINISNDGYLGPTAVMRQHLSNAVFRAVENGRPLLSVTNTGISAYITPRGEVREATAGFIPATRIWTIDTQANRATFYLRHGDLFVICCTIFSLLAVVFSFVRIKE